MVSLGLEEVTTIVTYNPWTVSPETRLADMVYMLCDAELHQWPVVDEAGTLVGIVSAGDVVRAVERQAAQAQARGVALPEPDILESCLVRDCMTRQVATIEPRATMAYVLHLLVDRDIRALPVMEGDELVGLVSSADVLREFSCGAWPAGRQPVTESIEPVAEPIQWDATLDEAARAIQGSSSNYAGVVRSDFPLGVISRRDIQLAQCRDTARRFWGDVWCMSGPATVRELVASAPHIRPGQRLAEAAMTLVDHGRQALAVVNRAGRLLGVVTEEAILKGIRSGDSAHSP